MALTLKTIQNLETLLTSDRISYKGSEVTAVYEILTDLRKEHAMATSALRVVPQMHPTGKWVDPSDPPAKEVSGA